MNTFDCLIPVPQRVEFSDKDTLTIAEIKNFYIDDFFVDFIGEIKELFSFFTYPVAPVDRQDNAQLVIFQAAMPPEGFRINIASDRISITAADSAGLRYAIEAMRQMIFAATISGPSAAQLTCGELEDFPRFSFRSFHLDSARHFQKPAVIKRMLKFMAAFRLNTFHWHLVYSQGWRLQLKSTAGLENRYTNTPGFYTAEEIAEIADFAQKLDISIIPEIDFPGHSKGTLQFFPQYACPNASDNAKELCIGNPASKEFVKNILKEVMDLFPRSTHIHIGGDEANTDNWAQCPLCQAAMQKENCQTMRELENKFMYDIAQMVIDQNKTPIVWGTCSGQIYQKETVVQAWLDIREPLRVAPYGNKVIYSVHNSLYFDYPANLSEPWETWMFELTAQGVYMTDPHIIWQDKVKDTIIGTEACLWTETVPQWRIIPKMLPRLYAYSECAWSDPDKKDYADFCRRQELLAAAGYFDYLTISTAQVN
jgi:hexosaminidase